MVVHVLLQSIRYISASRLSCALQANIQKLGDGLFLQICRDLASSQQYQEIEFSAMIVDNASMQLVARPEQFNGGILLMPNLYGKLFVVPPFTLHTFR